MSLDIVAQRWFSFCLSCVTAANRKCLKWLPPFIPNLKSLTILKSRPLKLTVNISIILIFLYLSLVNNDEVKPPKCLPISNSTQKSSIFDFRSFVVFASKKNDKTTDITHTFLFVSQIIPNSIPF